MEDFLESKGRRLILHIRDQPDPRVRQFGQHRNTAKVSHENRVDCWISLESDWGKWAAFKKGYLQTHNSGNSV